MAIELDDPRLALVGDPADAEPSLLHARAVLGTEPVAAEVVLDRCVDAVQVGGTGARNEDDAVLLAPERAGERRDDEVGRFRARLRVIGGFGSEDVPCVLHEHVLEAASGPDERDSALARGRHRGESALHASVRACGREPDTGEAPLELVRGRHSVGRDPLTFRARVRQARVERRVGLVRGVVVADDAYEHEPTLARETADTIEPVAAPLKKDQEIDLKVDSLAYGGNGVARLNGFVVFGPRRLSRNTGRTRVQ